LLFFVNFYNFSDNLEVFYQEKDEKKSLATAWLKAHMADLSSLARGPT
jgi:hypothetical protein